MAGRVSTRPVSVTSGLLTPATVLRTMELEPLHFESRDLKNAPPPNRHTKFGFHHALGSLVSYRDPYPKSLREFAMDSSYDEFDGEFQMTLATRSDFYA
jgi:hypothetical protein